VGQNQSGSWGIRDERRGLLYVDSDLNQTGPFVQGAGARQRTRLGHIWVLGGLIVRGKRASPGGRLTVLFALSDPLAIARYAGQFVTLSWREK
jgi:hypothetical protein